MRSIVFAAVFVTAMIPSSVLVAQKPVPPDSAQPRRAILEQRLRQRTAEVVKRRLQLNDEQMKQLQATNARFARQRGDLLMREREARRELRKQMLAGTDANENQVGQLLEQTMQIERQRLDLVQSEQRELAKFLKPTQRAKLFGLQTEMRRRTQELRAGAMQRSRMQGRPLPPGAKQPRGIPPRGDLRFDR